MTIAACYVSPEGVVLGADSTSTFATADGNHYYNHGQKIFEIGVHSTLGLVTWGLGGLATVSYRKLVAELSDGLSENPASDVSEVAQRWVDLIWPVYSTGPIKPAIDRCGELNAKQPFDPQNPADQARRTSAEEEEFQGLRQGLVVGFCIGGYLLPSRDPRAFQIIIDPLQGKPSPTQLPIQSQLFWGAPNIIRRLVSGCDPSIASDIISSGKWAGTPQELDAILHRHALQHPVVPIRDAVDFTYSCIYSTIKAFKFSNLSQICGGPIEIAVITTDRKFRWICHKTMDAAIVDGANLLGGDDL